MSDSRFKFGLTTALFLGVILPVAGSVAVHIVFPGNNWVQAPLHSAVEASGALAALSLAVFIMLLWKYRKEFAPGVWISCALIGMGVLDALHASVPPGNSFVWLRSTSTLLGGFLFVLVWLPERIARSKPAGALPALTAVAVGVFGALSIIFSDALPAMVSQGVFTSAAKGINILGGVFFLLAAIYFIISHRTSGSSDELLFANLALLFGFSGLLFQFSSPWEPDWWFWHLLRLTAYIVALWYVFAAYQGTMEDLNMEVAERKHAEESIEKLRRKNELILSSALEGIFGLDSNGKHTFVNPSAARMLGYEVPELIDKPSHKAWHHSKPDGSRYPEEECPIYAAYKDGAVHRISDEVFWRKDGSKFQVEYTSSPIVEEGKIVGAVVTFTDITERRKIEEKLNQHVRDVMDAVNVLASSASEMFTATQQLASTASETATAVSQTSATAEELKQTARLSSEKAIHVSESAQKAAQVAQQGTTAVSENMEAINRMKSQAELVAESIVKLSEQAQAIGEITTTVNDLAEQSNLLAVNAAIEAAKAGEQGKGFSVVAGEIKSLAEQSKRATAQVRAILSDVQKATGAAVMATEQVNKAVEAGVKQAAEAGNSIRNLADTIVQASNAATQVAASSQQQLVGIDQIASVMENIRQATQQNSAGIKQVEKAAQDLNMLGQKLKAMAEESKV